MFWVLHCRVIKVYNHQFRKAVQRNVTTAVLFNWADICPTRDKLFLLLLNFQIHVLNLWDTDLRKAIWIREVFCKWHFTQFAGKLSCLNKGIIISITALKKRIISLDTTDGLLFILVTVSWRRQSKMFYFHHIEVIEVEIISLIGSELLPAFYLYARHLMPGLAHRCGNVQIMKDHVNKQTVASVMEQKLFCDAWLVKWFLTE